MKRRKVFAGILVLIGMVLFLSDTYVSFCQIGRDDIQKMKERGMTPTPQPPTPDPKAKPKPELYSISIDYFRTTTSYPGIELGDEETLRWSIRGRNVKDLRVEISPDVGQISLTRTDYTGESFRIENTRNVRPSRETTYKLRVTGNGISLGGMSVPIEKTETVTVTVRRPKLENVQPVVDQRNLKIKFIAKNSGDADFRPTAINVYHQIQGRGGVAAPAILREGTFTTSRIGIRKGEQAELGEITLPNREQALSHDELQIIVDIGASYVLPLESDRDTFTHRWELATVRINETLIDILGSLVRGSIRLNNYDGSGCCNISHNPYRSNDSYVELMGVRRTFSPPRLAFSDGAAYDYRGFINNLTAPSIGGRDLFSIQDGKIKLTIQFETGGTEIRGWEETWNVWHDLTAPDVDIRRLNVSVFFIPGIRAGRITYTGVEVSSEVDVTFVGAYDLLLGKWEPYLEREIKNRIRDEITSTLMRDDIRRRIEDGIADGIRRLPVTINRIVSVRGEGGTISINYL